MGLLTERDAAGDGYEEVTIPLAPVEAAEDGAAEDGAANAFAAGDGVAADDAARRELTPGGGVILRRRSALPTRRSVLYLHCERDPFVPEDLVTWYTERGFHFYVADLRPEEALDKPARHRARPGQGERLARIDAACRHLREAGGTDMILVSAHAAGALTAALWCHARRDAKLADALILSRPAFGRRLRHGLDIACPVLVLSPAEGQRRKGVSRGKTAAEVRLGPHVTWLRLEGGLDGQTPDARGGRQRFFDETGRWLGAYMYGPVRDQLL